MATNFFSRWSQRKLDDSTDKPLEAEPTLEETQVASSEPALETRTSAEELVASNDPASIEPTDVAEDSADTKEVAPEATAELSMAQLLVSEASESVKKAALRKLFLSEEFNVRDGLDDYDDDYSNLKSLSEGVAETLRDWVKDKTEEDITPEEDQVIDNKDEGSVLETSESGNEVLENEFEASESAEITEEEKPLYKHTVSSNTATISGEDDLKEMGQNIPHKK